jgi:hypothetical protein
MIDLVGYDADSQTLEVRFAGSGASFVYYDVPQEEYLGLMGADSKGRYMRAHIIDVYAFSKVRGRKRR